MHLTPDEFPLLTIDDSSLPSAPSGHHIHFHFRDTDFDLVALLPPLSLFLFLPEISPAVPPGVTVSFTIDVILYFIIIVALTSI